MIIKPLDAVLTEFTNDAIHMVDPCRSIGLTAGLWFSIASVAVSDGRDRPDHRAHHRAAAGQIPAGSISPAEGRRAKTTGFPPRNRAGCVMRPSGCLAVLVVFGLFTLPPGAPLRNPDTGA